MAINEIRQQARRSAVERVARLRQQRADRVKKQEVLSAEVMTALAERDALIVDARTTGGNGTQGVGVKWAEPGGGNLVVRARRQGRRPSAEACA